MKKPDNCRKCWFCDLNIDDTTYVCLLSDSFENVLSVNLTNHIEIPEWCPLNHMDRIKGSAFTKDEFIEVEEL